MKTMKLRWKLIHIKTNENIEIKKDGIWYQDKPKYYYNLDDLKNDILKNKSYFEKLKDKYAICEEKIYTTEHSLSMVLEENDSNTEIEIFTSFNESEDDYLDEYFYGIE